ncbi:integrase catalytic domain-containing protein [Burkholderia sp. PU8-34]
MLTLEELEAIFRVTGVTDAGRKLVLSARVEDPSGPDKDRVKGKMAGEFYFRKTERMIYCPDAEKLFPVLMELDSRDSLCCEVWQWVKPIGITHKGSRDARNHRATFTPFLLDIRRDKIQFVDFIPLGKLQGAVKRGSDRYQFDPERSIWTSPPTEAALARFGFGYRICTKGQFGDDWYANALYLHEYLSGKYELKDRVAANKLLEALRTGFRFLPIKEVIQTGLLGRSDLNKLIVDQEVWFPVQTWSLADPNAYIFADEDAYKEFMAQRQRENAVLGRDENSAAIGVRFIWHRQSGWAIYGEEDGFWKVRCGKQLEKIEKAAFVLKVHKGEIIFEGADVDPRRRNTQEAVDFAKWKIDVLEGREPAKWKTGVRREGREITALTLSVWSKQYNDAKLKYPEYPVLGMIPLWRDRGGHNASDPELQEIWDDVYKRRVLGKRWNIVIMHEEFCVVAEERGLDPWSYETSRVHWREAKNSVFLENMYGRTVRYKYAGHVNPINRNKLYSFSKPYILAHADHTPLSIRLKNSATGRRIYQTLWLSYLIDNATGEKLAYVLCFWPPSARTISLLLFACLDRHKFLPALIVVDNGPEFHSIVTHNIVKEAGCNIVWRPPYEPRYGGAVESANRQTELRNLRALVGQTVTVKNIEIYERAFKSSNPELLTLTQLMGLLDAAFYEWEFESRSAHSGELTMSEHIEHLLEGEVDKDGVPAYRTRLEMTEDVRRICMPYDSRGTTRQVQPGGYIEYRNLPYYDNSLKALVGKYVEFKPDLIDPARVYIYCKASKGARWITGLCQKMLEFSHYSWRELDGIVAEMRLDGTFRRRSDSRTIYRKLIERLRHGKLTDKQLDVDAGKAETVSNMRSRSGFGYMARGANAGSQESRDDGVSAAKSAVAKADTAQSDESNTSGARPQDEGRPSGKQGASPPQSGRDDDRDDDGWDELDFF